ncbi:unnamed protein product [Heterosigma akashiwo]
MPQFLAMLRDEDLDALACLNERGPHHQPLLVAELVGPEVLPVVCETVELRLERVVDLGPFKHKVDDGLPLRKAALAVADTVLDTLPERMDLGAFLPFLARGPRPAPRPACSSSATRSSFAITSLGLLWAHWSDSSSLWKKQSTKKSKIHKLAQKLSVQMTSSEVL